MVMLVMMMMLVMMTMCVMLVLMMDRTRSFLQLALPSKLLATLLWLMLLMTAVVHVCRRFVTIAVTRKDHR